MSEKLAGNISVEKVDYSFYKGLTINNLVIKDVALDTIVYIKKAILKPNIPSLIKQNFIIESIRVDDSKIKIYSEKGQPDYNFSYLIDYFNKTDSSPSNWKVNLKELILNNVTLKYNDYNYPQSMPEINYDNIEISNLFLNINNISFLESGIKCNVKRLELKEQIGFVIKDFVSPDVSVSEKGIEVKELITHTALSYYKGNVNFLYNDYYDLVEFIDSVYIDSKVDTSFLDFQDIRYFSNEIEGLDEKVEVKGIVKGHVADLKVSKGYLDIYQGPKFKGSVFISGIPYPEKMYISVKSEEAFFRTGEEKNIPIYPFYENMDFSAVNYLNKLDKLTFTGICEGLINDLDIYGITNSNLGKLSVDARISFDIEKGLSSLKYSGIVTSKKILLSPFFYDADTSSSKINIFFKGSGNSFKNTQLLADGKFNDLTYNGINISNLYLNATIKNNTLTSLLKSSDKNLPFNITSKITFSEPHTKINFEGLFTNVIFKNSILKNTNLIGSSTFNIKGNIIFSGQDTLTSEIILDDFSYTKEEEENINYEKAIFNIKKIKNSYSGNIKSDFLDASINGSFILDDITKVIKDKVSLWKPSEKTNPSNISQNDFSLIINIKKSALINKFFSNGLVLSDSSSFSSSYDGSNNNLKLVGFGREIRINETVLDNFKLNFNSSENNKYFLFAANKINFNKNIFIKNFSSELKQANDTVKTIISWKNHLKQMNYKSSIKSWVVKEKENFIAALLPSQFNIGDDIFLIDSVSLLSFDKHHLDIDAIEIKSKEKSILIDGKINQNKGEINIGLTKFSIKDFMLPLNYNYKEIAGLVDINVKLKRENEKNNIAVNLNSKKITISGETFDSNSISLLWSESYNLIGIKGFLKSKEHSSISLNGNSSLLGNEAKKINLIFKTDNVRLAIFKPFYSNYLTNVSGNLNTKLHLSGNLGNPQFKGYINIKAPQFKVSSSGGSYHTDSIYANIQKRLLKIKKGPIKDSDNQVAMLFGNADISSLDNPYFDLSLTTKKFRIINTTPKENEVINGVLNISGKLNIKRSNNSKFLLTADIKTLDNSYINTVLNRGTDLSDIDYVSFVSKKNKKDKNTANKKSSTNYLLDLNAEITPATKVNMKFDANLNDEVNVKGTGNMHISLSNESDISIKGDYLINEGDFTFTLVNILEKKFKIDKGSSLNFSGPLNSMSLNMSAVNSLKAPIYDLIKSVDTSETYKSSTVVDVLLKVNGNFSNPKINFSIGLPELSESVKETVNSFLVNPSEINTQVFSLLLLKRFTPPKSNNGLLSNIGSASSAQIISSQINRWLGKLNTDNDFGIKYSPEVNISNSNIELSLSTKLFNERLSLYGNVSYSMNQTTTAITNNNKLLRDLSLEYKLSKDGNIKFKAFNRFNQFDLTRVNNNYTQGVGIYFTENFNTTKELFNKILRRFRRKKKAKPSS